MTATPIESKRPEVSRAYRWTILLFVSLTMGSNYYMYDSINPLEQIFIRELGFTAVTFGWLNSAYAVAAILTLLGGGLVVDRVGTRRAITYFALVCCAGAALTAASGRPSTMIAGRVVLGLGGESLVVASTTAIAKWFRGKELSFAFGVKITIARLASVASDNSPTWANKLYYPHGPAAGPSWQGPLLLGVGAGLIAILCSGIYSVLEGRAAAHFEPTPIATSKPNLHLKDILRFPLSYWFIVGICVAFYSAIFPFRTFAIDFFTNKILASHGHQAASELLHITARKQAGMFASLLPLSAMVATPLLGLLSDKVGKRASLMLLASGILAPVYLIMGYTNVSLFVPLCMMGVAFSVIPAVMWPSVAYVVEQKRLGTAYALMTLIEQGGFFVLNLLIGKVNDYKGAGPQHLAGYRTGLLIFTAISLAGLVFAALLRVREVSSHSHGLETITANDMAS